MQRLVVDLGGVYFQSIALAGFAICAVLTHSALWSRVELMTLASILFNLNPVLRFDGYWAVADLIGAPNLSSTATRTLAAAFRLTAPPKIPFPPMQSAGLAAYAMFEICAYVYVLTASISLLRNYGVQNLFQASRHLYAGQLNVRDFLTVAFTALALFIVVTAAGRTGSFLVTALKRTGAGRPSHDPHHALSRGLSK